MGWTDGDDADEALVASWLALLEKQSVDFTSAWRRLGDAAGGDARPLAALFTDAGELGHWLERWRARAERDGRPEAVRSAAMHRVNPLYLPRNERVEEALGAASNAGDLGPFDRLLDVVTRPFDERPGLERFTEPAPREVAAHYRTFCGT